MPEYNMKQVFDGLIKKYETAEFIVNDPVQFPHRFLDHKDIEVSAFLASCLAYGRRDKIIKSVDCIHEIMQNEPANFVQNFDYEKDKKLFDGFIHRYTAGADVALFMHVMGEVLREYKTVENLFMLDFDYSQKNVKSALTSFVEELCKLLPPGVENIRGFNFLFPNPQKGSACKRLNMALRWLVRKGPVDLDLWRNVPSSMLMIPLDTHVAKLARKYALTTRRADDWKTAEEITDRLRELNPNDPAGYDFALFGMGVSKEVLELDI